MNAPATSEAIVPMPTAVSGDALARILGPALRAARGSLWERASA